MIAKRSAVALFCSFAALAAGAVLPGRAAGFVSAPLPDSTDVTEPGIDVAADGTVFVNAPLGVPSWTMMWRSRDDGASFTEVVPDLPWSLQPGGADGDVVLTDDQRVYMLDLWAGSNSIARSEDNGDTWIEGTPVTTLPLSDRQWISLGARDAVLGRDTVYVVYHLLGSGSLMFARSIDGGLTWELHKPIPGTTGVSALPGQVVSSGDFIATPYSTGGAERIAISSDAGLSWHAQIIDDNGRVDERSIPSVAMQGSTMVVTWVDRIDRTIKVARSTNRGSTWSAPVTLATGGKSNIYPWIALRGSKVGVAWYGATNATGAPDDVGDGATWDVKYAESTNGGVSFGAPVTAVAHVKDGAICTQGILCGSNRELGDFLQLAIAPSGKTLISYINAVAGGAFVARQA